MVIDFGKRHDVRIYTHNVIYLDIYMYIYVVPGIYPRYLLVSNIWTFMLVAEFATTHTYRSVWLVTNPVKIRGDCWLILKWQSSHQPIRIYVKLYCKLTMYMTKNCADKNNYCTQTYVICKRNVPMYLHLKQRIYKIWLVYINGGMFSKCDT